MGKAKKKEPGKHKEYLGFGDLSYEADDCPDDTDYSCPVMTDGAKFADFEAQSIVIDDHTGEPLKLPKDFRQLEKRVNLLGWLLATACLFILLVIIMYIKLELRIGG